NLVIAAGISIIVSALYFMISPVGDERSELINRISPTIFDVFIAFFGGLAGIVAGSRTEKSNAIPGVAIATALMPPLCTAGFGIATAEWKYFFGAFYLFSINCVFISLSTYLIVRLLRYPKKEFLDPVRERRVRVYIFVFVVAVMIPSIYTAYRVIKESRWKQNARRFLQKELQFDNCRRITEKIFYSSDSTAIEVILFGELVPEEEIEERRARLKNYGLEDTYLFVQQGRSDEDEGIDPAAFQDMEQKLKANLLEDFYKGSQEQIRNKDERIKVLEAEVFRLQNRLTPIDELINEVKAINKNVAELSLGESILSQVDSLRSDTLLIAYAKFRKRPRKTELEQLEVWLKARTKTEKLRLVSE
ncbi:MAG: DUF389 domain-containing protein, partial [Bacteroidota bacterium]